MIIQLSALIIPILSEQYINKKNMKYVLIISVALIFIPTISSANNVTDSISPKNTKNKQIEYRHNISFQTNPTIEDIRLMVGNQTTNIYRFDWYTAIRYTYTLHPNILVGGEISYQTNESYDVTYSKKNEKQRDYGYWDNDYGVLARFIYNKPKWLRPFAEVVFGCRRGFALCHDFDNNRMPYVSKYYAFQWYAAAGVSFRFWKNHFNIDLMCKASNYHQFINWGRVVFSWKIGYNFNAKKQI